MTSLDATPVSLPCGSLDHPNFEVFLETEDGARILDRESVQSPDLALVASHTWLEFCLRRGRPDRTLADLEVRLVLVPSKSSGRYAGFALQAPDPDRNGELMECIFSVRALEAVARRSERRLAESGTLKDGELFLFGVDAPHGTADVPAMSPARTDRAEFDIVVQNPPMHFLSIPVRPLIAQSRVEGEMRENAFPVFYTEAVLAQAERCARQGTPDNPHFESGALLAGSLGSCPETGEFFIVITDAFEMTDAESSLVKLELTAGTWTRIQAVIRARQSVEPATNLLGNAHGHNFLPNNGATCAECPQLEECSTTNLHPSPDDLTWTRTHFPHAPYAQCHIFGLSARGDKLQGLFGLHDGRLMKRHYFVLPDFDPGRHPTISVPQSR